MKNHPFLKTPVLIHRDNPCMVAPSWNRLVSQCISRGLAEWRTKALLNQLSTTDRIDLSRKCTRAYRFDLLILDFYNTLSRIELFR